MLIGISISQVTGVKEWFQIPLCSIKTVYVENRKMTFVLRKAYIWNNYMMYFPLSNRITNLFSLRNKPVSLVLGEVQDLARDVCIFVRNTHCTYIWIWFPFKARREVLQSYVVNFCLDSSFTSLLQFRTDAKYICVVVYLYVQGHCEIVELGKNF